MRRLLQSAAPVSTMPNYTNYTYYHSLISMFNNPIALHYNAYDARRQEHGFRWSHIWGPTFQR